MKVATVIPVGPGRFDNLAHVLTCLREQNAPPELIVLVCDGPDAKITPPPEYPIPLAVAEAPKHQPGNEQPRNMGVRIVEQVRHDLSHVWFLDSDVIVEADCLEKYQQAMAVEPEPRILVGPYDWLPPGTRHPEHGLNNDPRWARFNESYPWQVWREDLSAGLACFSGNLIWPIEMFKHSGGFWNELHHGRCEDGELGLRAVGMGLPISFVPEARGWHLHHERNLEWIRGVNAIDVPKLNARHPWKELGEGGEELFVVEEDGKRFNWRCPMCGEEMNSALIWGHQEAHHAAAGE